jgi:hypothetical protein
MPLSNTTRLAWLNDLFSSTTWLDLYVTASPPNLFTGTGGTRPIGNGYSILEVPASSFSAAALSGNDAIIENDTTLTFADPTGSWGNCGSVLIWGAADRSIYLGGETFSPAITPVPSNPARFLPGRLIIRLPALN